MALSKKKKTLRSRYDAWLATHPKVGDVLVFCGIALALIGTFAFVTFSGFGSTAEFIYNQF